MDDLSGVACLVARDHGLDDDEGAHGGLSVGEAAIGEGFAGGAARRGSGQAHRSRQTRLSRRFTRRTFTRDPSTNTTESSFYSTPIVRAAHTSVFWSVLGRF